MSVGIATPLTLYLILTIFLHPIKWQGHPGSIILYNILSQSVLYLRHTRKGGSCGAAEAESFVISIGLGPGRLSCRLEASRSTL
jgi:hypothetical protein